MRFGELGAASLECALAVVGDQLLAGFNQRRQRRLGVGGNRKIDVRVALEILVIALGEQVARADADQL